MAEIYLAHSQTTEGIGRFYAIKKLPFKYADNKEFIDMFKSEASMVMNLSHGNLVHVVDFGVSKGSFFIVMDFVRGRNLRQVLRKMAMNKKAFTLSESLYIASKIATGLDYTHNAQNEEGQKLNIIHRDISPQNIMMSFNGELKIVDFGIAKNLKNMSKTESGILKGKFSYMSPEQSEGNALNCQTDIFSFGIILWELLANARLFVAKNEMEILKKIRKCEIPSVREYNPNIPPEVEKIVKKALEKDKNKRYQTTREMEKDILHYLNKTDPGFSSNDLAITIKSHFVQEIQELNSLCESYKKEILNMSENNLSEIDDDDEVTQEIEEVGLTKKEKTGVTNVKEEISFRGSRYDLLQKISDIEKDWTATIPILKSETELSKVSNLDLSEDSYTDLNTKNIERGESTKNIEVDLYHKGLGKKRWVKRQLLDTGCHKKRNC